MFKTAVFTASSLALALASLGIAPSHAQMSPSDEAVGSLEPARECVSLRLINGYSVIDDRHVILNGGVSRHWLVTTRQRCSGLRFGAQVGTSFGDNVRLCPPIVEYLVPSDGWRCPIDTIEAVESEDAARSLVERRAAAAAATSANPSED